MYETTMLFMALPTIGGAAWVYLPSFHSHLHLLNERRHFNEAVHN